MTVAAPSEAWVACWDCGFESRRRQGCLSLLNVVCCQVVVSATGRSLVQRSSTECCVPECDLETSTKGKSRPTRTSDPREQIKNYSVTAIEMCKDSCGVLCHGELDKSTYE